jgi:phospholipase/carboxylesterase
MTAISEVLHQGPTLAKASQALLLLHGRGGTAKSILSLADLLSLRDAYTAAPQAAHHTWYPYSFMEEDEKNEPYLSQSVQEIKDLIDQIAKSIPQKNIYIAGFSQGACLALEVAARFAAPYGGIIAFTGALIGSAIDEKRYQGDFKQTPVFISNGDQDPHIPLIRSEQSKEILEKLGANVTLKVYPGRPHTITEDEIAFANQVLSLESP